uniref:beta-alanine transporter n=1 Tax=Anopheles coluzzii TaxID=1518534 RepID=UPI001AADFC0B|nr:beta-alanine transporter [Anopheles coluzzii]XP_040219334.1 beta-alanine transporter [Anopheles coluzzii]XP_040219335.1 beta-alanine transporter [Anopheles coluzzii]
MDTPDDSYDEIMAQAGNDGKFQRRYNLLFNFGAICFASMSYMSIILALNKPPHNCFVPGMEQYNITDANLWKNLTLPRETDNRGQLGYSKCQMYNITEQHLQRHYSEWSFASSDIIDCAYGYEYDRTYYDRTPITEYDWICDKGFRETNIFIYNRLGELFGTVIFGHLGDTLGRRPVFYLSILIITVGRLVSMFTAAYYVVFCIAAVVGSLTAHSIFQAPLIIAMEISKSERRGHISMMQCIGWTTGLCILPMVFWATKDWFWALLIVTMPIVLFMFIPSYTIESPRWLATRGNYREAMVQFRKIATINGIRELAFDERVLEKRLANHRTDKVYGLASLFNGWRMAKNTMLVILCWTVCSVTYFTLVLLSSRMDGNPFLNFMYQGLIEVPAAFAGQRAADRFGRRATNAMALCCATAVCLVLVLIVRDPANEMAATVLTTFVKFCISITFFGVNLQSIEIYPTCLRQTGMAVGTIAATIFGIVGPYVVHLGTEYDVRYPFLVMGLSSAVGILAALFLPETLHQSLPNTIEEAQKFGKNQRFWSLPKAPQVTREADSNTDKRHDGSDAKPEESIRLTVPIEAEEAVGRK